ncbi:MAG TPA: hypothetical protein DCE24_04045 [Porphyromonadaceae bacterium]|jgi:hypothetical protein|nr:hypothetical protein [Paramuribaculum sp.]HAB41007.1 hypothetical protein [Porphyromonadaceae bacterium]
MDKALKAKLSKDPDGLQTYEYIANNIQEIDPILDELIENMVTVDPNGQFTVSAARYLNAIDSEKYAPQISRLIEAAIDKDRERNYLAQLLPSIWGEDYEARHEELNASDNNFRRIYKRVYPAGI